MKSKKKIISTFLLALVFNVSITSSSFINAATKQLEVHYINVGQGDATYIELPDGTDILIDSGTIGSGATIVKYLKAQEKDIDIEYLIATHPDADHIGGMQSVFKELKIKNFYYPKDAVSNTKTWKAVLDLTKKEKCNIVDANKSKGVIISGVSIKFIQPKVDYSTDNNDSVVTYLKYKNADFLFTGDIESKVEKDLLSAKLVSNVDFMTVPHHGSKSSSTSSFVKKIKPKYSIVSVGKNSYGHPNSDVLKRYTQIKSKIYRTDKNGNIIVKTDGYTAKINNTKANI